MIMNLVNRYRKKHLTANEITYTIRSSLNDIEWLRKYNNTLYNHLKNYEYSNGEKAEAIWRNDFLASINMIANEITWDMQKQALIKTMLGTASLAGMAEAIFYGYVDNTEYYEDIVGKLEPFKINDRAFWKTLVAEMHQKNKLDLALLQTIAERTFGLNEITTLSIKGYGSLIKESFKRKLLFKKMVIRYGSQVPKMGHSLVEFYDEYLQPIVIEEQRLMSNFHDDIVNEDSTNDWMENILELSKLYNDNMDAMNEGIDKLVGNK